PAPTGRRRSPSGVTRGPVSRIFGSGHDRTSHGGVADRRRNETMNRPPSDLRAVFDRAMELESPADRARYLAQACGTDAAVRREVDTLLKAFGKAGDFFEPPAPAPPLTAESPGPAEGPGPVIGPYTLREPIGEGGMGVVYVAEQHNPVRRKVA